MYNKSIEEVLGQEGDKKLRDTVDKLYKTTVFGLPSWYEDVNSSLPTEIVKINKYTQEIKNIPLS